MKNQPNRNYNSNDIVMTPPEFAKEIINYFNPEGIVLEPCMGDGAFYNNFKQLFGCNLMELTTLLPRKIKEELKNKVLRTALKEIPVVI
jgi:hypothetical protein